MQIHSPEISAIHEPAAELDRLGDEIAELAAHLDAATARLLDLIREFDARGGWNIGPAFGVCLGLQGMVEYFGGTLGLLDPPVHGKASRIRVRGGRLFEGLPAEFTAGRYHSLYAIRERLPAVLEVTAESDDSVVMAIEHATLPLAAVQFHPESIMTLARDVGLRLLANVMDRLASAP